MAMVVLLILVLATCSRGFFLEPSQCNYQNRGARLVADCSQRGLAHTNLDFNQQTDVLDFSQNEVERLRTNQFRDVGLVNLQELILRENWIAQVDAAAFHGLLRLNSLDLSHNKITALPKNLFLTNVQLNKLQLSHNPLKQISEPLGTYLIRELDLSRCSLNQVPQTIVAESKQLQRLDIADNYIKEIDKGMLSNLVNLQELYFERNPITCNNDAEQLKLWLLDKNIQFNQFCSSFGPYSNVFTHFPRPPESHPPRHLIKVNDIVPPPYYGSERREKRAWHEHWMFPVLATVVPAVNLMLLITLVILLRRHTASQTVKDSRADEESLPPYI